jgi:hypothetical protein
MGQGRVLREHLVHGVALAEQPHDRGHGDTGTRDARHPPMTRWSIVTLSGMRTIIAPSTHTGVCTTPTLDDAAGVPCRSEPVQDEER